jgi:hypothetical protein
MLRVAGEEEGSIIAGARPFTPPDEEERKHERMPTNQMTFAYTY